MSSPIAKLNKKILDNVLIFIHQKASHGKRVHLLSELFVEKIQSIDLDKREVHLLDIGCGDMSIGNTIAKNLNELKCTGIDIYSNVKKWENYYEFDGKTIPFEDKKFDIALFSDVLHHDFDNISILLTEAKRVSQFVIIKDHFEYGFFSRKVLQLADVIGNYGYGVSIPSQYFTKESYYDLLKNCDLKEIDHMCPIQLYDNPLVKSIFKDKFQFISILT